MSHLHLHRSFHATASETRDGVASHPPQGVEAINAREAAEVATKVCERKIEELEQTIATMEAARDEAEALRTELREQHTKDLEEGQSERDSLVRKNAELTEDLDATQKKLDETRVELLKARQVRPLDQAAEEARSSRTHVVASTAQASAGAEVLVWAELHTGLLGGEGDAQRAGGREG